MHIYTYITIGPAIKIINHLLVPQNKYKRPKGHIAHQSNIFSNKQAWAKPMSREAPDGCAKLGWNRPKGSEDFQMLSM